MATKQNMMLDIIKLDIDYLDHITWWLGGTPVPSRESLTRQQIMLLDKAGLKAKAAMYYKHHCGWSNSGTKNTYKKLFGCEYRG